MKNNAFLFVAICLSITLTNCSNDDDKCNYTYENGVKEIIDRSCAYAGCHAGAEASMWVPDNSVDQTNYEGMLENLNSGEFENRTLILRNMPDTMWTPDDRPQILTEEEIEILTCWKDNGYPES